MSVHPGMQIEHDDPARADVFALLDEHLRNMRELSPPESVHALDVTGLQSPEVTFWSIRTGGALLGCGALKELSATHGEVKSMRTPADRAGLVFFDRSVLESLAMLHECRPLPETELRAKVASYHFHGTVFLLPPWARI